jgi:AraC-like DNA-binding protein/mannose-6-phosphate isomerase-like protein (cupin superfamily)
MRLDYRFKPTVVKKIFYISHKGKEKNYKHPTHKHAQGVYEIIYMDYGNIHFELDGKQLNVTPGECIFIKGNTKHSFSGKDGVPFNFLNIMFEGQLPPELVGIPCKVVHGEQNILWRIIHESLRQASLSYELTACYLTEFIINLIMRQAPLEHSGKIPHVENLQHYQSEIVQRAISVITNEYSTRLTLKKICSAIGISESHLRALIRKETGKSFSSLLHTQRIAVAKHLLNSSNFSYEEIASAIGYNSPSFFFKIFKRLTGMTPKTYASSLGDTEG